VRIEKGIGLLYFFINFILFYTMDRRWHQNDYHIREITRVQDDVMPRAKNLKEAYNNFYEDEVRRCCEINPMLFPLVENGFDLVR